MAPPPPVQPTGRGHRAQRSLGQQRSGTQGDARRACGAARVSQEVPTQLSPATGPERAEARLPAPAFAGCSLRGAGLRSPEGGLRWELGQAGGLESESQTPEGAKRLLPLSKGFTQALLRGVCLKFNNKEFYGMQTTPQ